MKKTAKKIFRLLPDIFLILALTAGQPAHGWGFYGHQKINGAAVFLLPPSILPWFKQHRQYLIDHSTDPDKRRYLVPTEGARHYIDMDLYGPVDSIPHSWAGAVKKYGTDTLQARGIVPWWILIMQERLTEAFRQKQSDRILQYAAELGHYIADAHVPLHAHSNHNGQYSNQHGIHGFWESRIPELLAESRWNFWIGKARYLEDVRSFIWERVKESGAAADTVLRVEKEVAARFTFSKYAVEWRKGKWVKQYAADFTIAYNDALQGMVERRMRQAIFAIASCWYTAWINAGQPDLSSLAKSAPNPQQQHEMEELNKAWLKGEMQGRKED